jgi:excisionase family DNA binding protein
MANQMINQPGGGLFAQGTAPAAPGTPGAAPVTAAATPAVAASPQLMNPAQVAEQLGVSEADVIATLEAGDLKGKKIGSQWRISAEALTEFLKH